MQSGILGGAQPPRLSSRAPSRRTRSGRGHRTVRLPSGVRPAAMARRVAPEAGALVRLRRREDRTVEVRFSAAPSRGVSNRNCVVATRGGEQRNENDQSVTKSRYTETGELDSVGEAGRAFERKAKPVERAIGGKPNRRTAGWPPDVAPMVGDGMAGSLPAMIRETRRGQSGVHGPEDRRTARRESERP